MNYRVSQRGKETGSFEAREIVRLVRLRQLSMVNKVFVSEKWVSMSDFLNLHEEGGLPHQKQNVTTQGSKVGGPKPAVQSRGNQDLSAFEDTAPQTQSEKEGKKERGYFTQVASDTLDETVSSGFLPFVLTGFAKAVRTNFSFLFKPFKTLSEIQKDPSSQSLMITCVSLFVTGFWLCDKYIWFVGDFVTNWLEGKAQSGKLSELNFVLPPEELYAYTGKISSLYSELEIQLSAVVIPMIFAVAMAARRGGAEKFVRPKEYIRPTITFVSCYGFVFVVALTIICILNLLACAYLPSFATLANVFLYILMAWAFYMFVSWQFWAATIFDISVWKMIGYYVLTSIIMGLLVALLSLLVFFAPLGIVHQLFSSGDESRYKDEATTSVSIRNSDRASDRVQVINERNVIPNRAKERQRSEVSISLVGGSSIAMKMDDPWIEPGYFARIDGKDGTRLVDVSNFVDVNQPRIYKVVYTLNDPDTGEILDSAERFVTVTNAPFRPDDRTFLNNGVYIDDDIRSVVSPPNP